MKCAPALARETKTRTSYRGQNEVVRGKRTFYRGHPVYDPQNAQHVELWR